MTPFGLVAYLPTVAVCITVLCGVVFLGYRAGVRALDVWIRGEAPPHDVGDSWSCRRGCECLDCRDGVGRAA